MKQWIIQKLFLNSALSRSTFIAGGVLWGILFLPASYLIFNIQLSSINRIETEKRNSIQELLAITFLSNSKYGDLVNARGMILKIGKSLGLTDLGICIDGAEAIPRAFENRCLNEISPEYSKKIDDRITLRFYWIDLKVNWYKIVLKAILSSLFFSFAMFLVTSIFYYRILKKRIHFLSQKIASENVEKSNPLETFSVPEMQPIVCALKDYRTKIYQYHQEKQQLESQAVFASIAKQVSHDIRSPLSALNLITADLSQIPEDRRILIRSAVQRINDISNQLLEKSKKLKTQENLDCGTMTSISVGMLSSLVDEVVSEKRISCRDKIGVSIDFDLSGTYGLFSKINTIELKRVLSNLLNNAIEALLDNSGKISVELVEDHNHTACIIIKDNGRGIPENIIKKLGTGEVTHGKEGTKSGSGLGFFHARNTVESFGGKITVSSELNVGTSVSIHLPLSDAPPWFTERLQITLNQIVVILDDDQSIHNIWEQRLSSYRDQRKIENVVNFTSAQIFKAWVLANSSAKTLFLIDYELLNQNLNGLQLIEELGIAKNSILVSSRYEEPSIRKKCESLNIKIIPKGFVGFIPIAVEKEKTIFDCCLIDDDDLIKATWLMAAKEYNKSIKVFSNYAEFEIEENSINRATPIYIDSNLSNGVKGENIAIHVFNMGFENLYLATGYDADSIASPKCIKKIVGKDFPNRN